MNTYEIDIIVEEEQEAQLADAGLDLALVEQAITAVLQAEAVVAPVSVAVLITDDNNLQRLNHEFRGRDEPTDVLSFADDGVQMPTVVELGEPRHLGDIAISYERVLAQAVEYGHSPARELAYLAAHGTLHLLGFDHETGPEAAAAMRTREEAVMATLGLTR